MVEEGRGGGERWEEGKRERRGEEERKVHSTTNICMYVNMNKIHMKVHMHILYVCMYVRACMYTSSMCSGGASQVGEGRCANVSTCRSTYVRTYVCIYACMRVLWYAYVEWHGRSRWQNHSTVLTIHILLLLTTPRG